MGLVTSKVTWTPYLRFGAHDSLRLDNLVAAEGAVERLLLLEALCLQLSALVVSLLRGELFLASIMPTYLSNAAPPAAPTSPISSELTRRPPLLPWIAGHGNVGYGD